MSQSALPSVRFYLLPNHASAEDWLDVVARLLVKAEAEQLQTAVRCEDETQALWLDEALWAYPPNAWLPHYYLENQETERFSERSHITLLTAPARVSRCDVWLDLSAETQVDLPRGCGRVLEVVWARNRDAARTRFRNYQQLGLNPQLHQLS